MDKEIMRSKVVEINNLHKEVFTGIKMTLDRVVKIGQLLCECKKELPHGVWMEWCKLNVEFSQKTVENYMKCYLKKDDPKFVKFTNLKEIYHPQLEHKKPEKVKEPEKKPLITAPVEKKPVEQEVFEPEIEDEDEEEEDDIPQGERLELIQEGFLLLDTAHKNKFCDWLEVTLEELVETA